ncbi:hypothetical protein HGH92_25960 [Chitinophaga varians]|uniref:HPt domain-containing protein n=1 Tax=Chitinophaga varians TaxID=2202339 RepID=A0A847S4K8_9BACT|nr:hypothetical protein [Chitinophaga varians]NLR67777.1 hypothetical protein [Chitinophaga varians]
MNQDPVFEFSEHFDITFLLDLYQNDIDYALDIFEFTLSHYPTALAELQVSVLENDWQNAAVFAHRLKADIRGLGLTQQGNKLGQLHNLIIVENGKDIAAINKLCHEIQFSLLSTVPIVCDEINRMKLYLDTYPPKIWNY